MLNLPDTASTATCAAIAQILPVFMVALVAERIAKLREPVTARKRIRLMLATTIRIMVDLILALSLLALTLAALIGIESEGLNGRSATALWTGTVAMGFAILYRWLLLSTPLLSFFNEINQIWVRLVFNSVESLGRAVPQSFAWIWTGVSRVLLVVTEVLFGFLTVGMFNGALSFSEWLAARILGPRAEKPSDEEKSKAG